MSETSGSDLRSFSRFPIRDPERRVRRPGRPAAFRRPASRPRGYRFPVAARESRLPFSLPRSLWRGEGTAEGAAEGTVNAGAGAASGAHLRDDLLIAVVNGLVRLLVLAHAGWTTLGAIALVAALVLGLGFAGNALLGTHGVFPSPSELVLSFGAGVLLLAVVSVLLGWAVTRELDINPFQQESYGGGMHGWLAANRDGFFAWMSHVRYLRWPFLLVSDPIGYGIRGDDVRQLLAVLKPGDIVLRGHSGYVESLIISLTGTRGNATLLSHAAVYLGDTTAEDEAVVASHLRIRSGGRWRAATRVEQEMIRSDPRFYQTAPQRVVHAMAQGVFTEDILSFAHCDYLAVIRVQGDTVRLDDNDLQVANLAFGKPAGDGYLGHEAIAIERRLMRGEAVALRDVLAAGRHSALSKIGSMYDFRFNDVRHHNVFSCSSLAYFSLKSIQTYIGVVPTRKTLLGRFFGRYTITPADIYEAALRQSREGSSGRLRIVWESASLGNRS